MTPQEIAEQLNQWFLGGSGRVTQLPGAAAPSTRKFYSTHKGFDLAIPQGTQLNTKGLEYIGSGIQGGYGQRLAAYDPKTNRTYYFSHLSNVRNTPQGIIALSGGMPGSYGAGNTTGAHVDIEFAPGRQAFSQMIKMPVYQPTTQVANKDYLAGLYRRAQSALPQGKKIVAIGTRKALTEKYGDLIKNAIQL